MSKKQRRDHAAAPKGDGDFGWCVHCHGLIIWVSSYPTNRHESGNGRANGHWRHVK